MSVNHDSRIKNSVRNASAGVISLLFNNILTFVARTFFIKMLGTSYLGLNGLFTNILSILSLGELGISQAIIFNLYQKIATHDEYEISALLNFCKKAYRIVALSISGIGITIMPLLPYLVNKMPNIQNIYLVYVLSLASVSVSYLYSYKGSILIADQRNYITIIFVNTFNALKCIIQIIILLLIHDYIAYLCVQVVTNFISNFAVSVYVDKKYPFLMNYRKITISSNARHDIFRDIRGLIMHKIGGFVLNGTDNIIISKFVGLEAVGVLSNYVLIIGLIKNIVLQIVSSIAASIGNLVTEDDKEKGYCIFNVSFMIHAWIYGICSICFWVMFSPFIKIWLGSDYLLSEGTLFLILCTFYCYGVQEAVNVFINATGLFWDSRIKPIFECSINIIFSVILVKKFGVIGVFAGTMIAFASTAWVSPYILYKKYFNKKFVLYLIRYTAYLIPMVFMAYGINCIANSIITINNILTIIYRLLFSIAVSFGFYFILFCKTKECLYIYTILKHTVIKAHCLRIVKFGREIR